jgi:hypothetical protein
LNIAAKDSSKMSFLNKFLRQPMDSDPTSATSGLAQAIEEIEDDTINEQSPLLPPGGSPGDETTILPLDGITQWLSDPNEVKSSGYMFLLTLGAFGYVL